MYDIDKATQKYFLRNPKPQVAIKKARILEINKEHFDLKVKDSYTGPWRRCIIRNKCCLPKEIYLPPLYKSPNTISKAKLGNLKTLLQFLSSDKKAKFYETIFRQQGFTRVTDQPESELVETDNDDNSSGCED